MFQAMLQISRERMGKKIPQTKIGNQKKKLRQTEGDFHFFFNCSRSSFKFFLFDVQKNMVMCGFCKIP